MFVPPGHKPFPTTILDNPRIKQYIQLFGDNPNDRAIVAEFDDELIGAVWGRTFQPSQHSFGFVDTHTPEISIAVKKEYRDKGVGTQLLDEVFKLYTKMGTDSLSLSVDKRNPAYELYLRTGFQVVRETKADYIMCKKLRV